MYTSQIFYKLNKDNISCSINIKSNPEENQLLIECLTSFKNYSYSSIINFKNKELFLNCSSSNDSIDLLTKYFYKGKIFIKEINNNEITFGIYFEENNNDEQDNYLYENKFNDEIFNSIYIFTVKKYINSNNNLILNKGLNHGYIYISHINKKEYVLWREANLKKYQLSYGNYLQTIRTICYEKLNTNLYFEFSIEKSLKYILKRKNDKVILLSNIGLDLSGKRFIEIARKILGFDIIILFFSNNRDHLKWLTEFPNCLITNQIEIYEKYISNYNLDGLKNLKKDIEQKYHISLKNLSDDCISYPYFEKEKNNSEEDDMNECINEYIRHVYIYCESEKLYLSMNKNKKVSSDQNGSPWDVTILNNEITLFSNGYYLDINSENNNIVGFPYMRIWNFEKNGEYYFISHIKNKNYFLSVEKGEIRFNKNKGQNQKFKLIDIADSCNDLINNSFLSEPFSFFNSEDNNESQEPKSFLSEKIFDQVISISNNSLISV